MRLAPVTTLGLVGVLLFPHGTMGQTGNECTTVVLHAVSGTTVTCQPSLDCVLALPVTQINNPVGPYTVYVGLKNFTLVEGVQVAFSWPSSWSFGFGLWECQPGQLVHHAPLASGPSTGTLSTTFDPISAGTLPIVGLMVFNSLGPSGCLSIIESSFPNGNVVYGTNSELTPLLDQNEGRVCSNAGGWDTCNCRPGVTSIPDDGPATWGKIKATYGH
jgi:hypothetical protein